MVKIIVINKQNRRDVIVINTFISGRNSHIIS